MNKTFERRALSAAAIVTLVTAGTALAGETKSFSRQFQEDRIIESLTRSVSAPNPNRVAACFFWNDRSVMVATDANGFVSRSALQNILNRLEDPQPELAYRAGDRWNSIATDGSVALREPITIHYSFVPDGLSIPGSNGEPTSPSNLFATFNAQPSFANEAAWKTQFANTFSLWATVSGIEYVEVADDGASFPSSPGSVGARGDVRISMHSIDGSAGLEDILAYNFFPDNGDMVMDTDNISFFANAGGSFRRLKNVVAHEHGHGLGYNHVDPIAEQKLMEAFASVAFTGPQTDDIRGIQFQYGDNLEANDTAATAYSLGALTPPVLGPGDVEVAVPISFSQVSIETNNVVDFYSFSVPNAAQLSVTLVPVGGFYQEGPQNGSVNTINASAINNLAFSIIDTDGTTAMTTVDATAAGSNETLTNFALPAAGTYYIRISESSSTNASQLYSLSIGYLNVDEPPPANSGNWTQYN